MPTIYSMLSNDRSFPLYEPASEGSITSKRKYKGAILVKGGANVADKYSRTQAYTETTVTAEELKLLEENPSFKRLVKRGFISKSKPAAPKKDKAAPKTKEDLKAASGKANLEVSLNTEAEAL